MNVALVKACNLEVHSVRTPWNRLPLQPAHRTDCPGCMLHHHQSPAHMLRLPAGADAKTAPHWSTPIQNARGCCRLRTSNGCRHCSLRVLQPVIGEHAASPHAPSAGSGRCASPSALSKHFPSPTVPTGSWFSGSHHDTGAAPCINFGPFYAGQRGYCSDIFRLVINPRSLHHQASI